MTAEVPVKSMIGLLQQCRQQKDLQEATRLRELLRERQLDSHPVLGNFLVPMLVDCGSLHEAQRTFDCLDTKDRAEHSWTSLIAGYSSSGNLSHALYLYNRMQEESCAQPSAHTLVAMLNICARLDDAKTGRALHSVAVKHGSDRKLHVGSALVDLYGSCGLLVEAQRVFDRLPIRNVVSWNALISRYSDHGYDEEVLHCFEQMQLEGEPVAAITFVCSLKACGSLDGCKTGQRLHAEATIRGLERELYLGSVLVDMYGKCGLLAEALQAFGWLPCRDAVSWTALIGGLAEHGDCKEVLACYKQMQVEGIYPDSVTFVYILKACISMRALDTGSELHYEITKAGLERELFLGNSLVDMYSKRNSLAEARKVLDWLLIRDAVSWNALIAGYAEQGLSEELLTIIQEMQHEGVLADGGTLLCSLKACSSIKALESGLQLHIQVTKRGFEGEYYIASMLVDMYTKCGLFAEAHQVISLLPVEDSAAWNALLTGYAEKGLSEQVLQCFGEMQQRSMFADAVTYVCCLHICGAKGCLKIGQEIHAEIIQKGLDGELDVNTGLVDMYNRCSSLAEACHVLYQQDTVSWHALVEHYPEQGDKEEQKSLVQLMQLEGTLIHIDSFICGLKICSVEGTLQKGQAIHSELIKRGLERELYAGSALVDMYGKCSSLDEACAVFERQLNRNIVSWNALITGLTDHGLGQELRSFFNVMLMEGSSPNSVTLICSLKACSTNEDLEMGCLMHCEIVKRGYEEECYIGSSLINMYCKCSSLSEAHWVFDSLPVQDKVSWTALIAGYAEHAVSKGMLEFLKKMQLEGVYGDAGTFVCCLKACYLVGASETGRELHSEIVKRGLEGEIHVGGALVDMYGKCGLLAEARQVFDRLPVRNAVAWNTLIAGYAEHGPSEEVLNSFKQMQLGGVPMDAVTFLSSLKACGTLGALETGRDVHFELTKRGLDNEPDVSCALTDMYGKCGQVIEAHQVFDCMPVQDTVMWTSLIAGYSENRLDEEVLKCFQRMMINGVFMGPVAFLCSLKACSTLGALDVGHIIHTEIAKRGLEKELYVGSTLIDMYGKCGSLVEAFGVYNRLPLQDAVSGTALVQGCMDHRFDEEMMRCFRQIQLLGVCVDAITYVSSLKACATVGALQMGQEIHIEIVKRGVERDLYVGSALVDMYGNCAALPEAHAVFDRLSAQDAVLWNTLITCYAEHGLNDVVLSCFKQMLLKGVLPEAVTFVLCLKACSKIRALDLGRQIHAEIRKAGVERNCYVGNMLVDMYGKCSAVVEGWEVFNRLPVRDVVSWTTMIKVYGENNEGKMAVQCFEEMQAQGVKPNSITFVCLLAACSHSSLVQEGQDYFKAMIEKFEFEPTLDHYACMVDLFARSGDVNEAERFVAAMQCPPSSAILKSLLTACKTYGKLELGHCCFQMLVEAHQEDSATYSLMMDIYASAGRWSDAKIADDHRKGAGAKKKPGYASIEVKNKLHEFAVCSNHSQDIENMSELLLLHIMDKGYVPNFDLLSGHFPEEKNQTTILKFTGNFFGQDRSR